MALNIDQKAREVRIEEEKPKAEEKSNAGNFRCFRCNEMGHMVVDCPKPSTQRGKGKVKGKAMAKTRGKGKVDGNCEEENREK